MKETVYYVGFNSPKHPNQTYMIEDITNLNLLKVIGRIDLNTMKIYKLDDEDIAFFKDPQKIYDRESQTLIIHRLYLYNQVKNKTKGSLVLENILKRDINKEQRITQTHPIHSQTIFLTNNNNNHIYIYSNEINKKIEEIFNLIETASSDMRNILKENDMLENIFQGKKIVMDQKQMMNDLVHIAEFLKMNLKQTQDTTKRIEPNHKN